jgi:hypothetical protein
MRLSRQDRGGSRRRGRRGAYGVAAFLVLGGALAAWSGAAAADSTEPTISAKKLGVVGKAKSGNDTIHVGPDVFNGNLKIKDRNGQVVTISKRSLRKSAWRRKARARTARRAGVRPLSHNQTPPAIGEERMWLALDNAQGFFYRKRFTLRALGDHVELWVASPVPRLGAVGTDFLPGDCRNGPRTTITEAQVNYLRDEFDDNILPTESAAFSVAPDRDGAGHGAVPPLEGVGFNPAGQGDDTVVLIDNVRDTNFYDLNNVNAFSYIAGFFSSGLNALADRNIMTIDAFDWLHRTGATPPHEPVPGNNCTSAPARPFLYEGVFAHEYQHLLESYEDADETNWVNEGLSDFAQTITGYVDPSRPVTEIGFDSHTQCFLGWLGVQTDANPNPRDSGPENSLTLWGDQGDDEILCDYGAAYTSMEYYSGQFGLPFMSRLHRDDAGGFAGLQSALNAFAPGTNYRTLVHRWSVMAAIDGLLDQGRKLSGGAASRYRTPTLHALINWNTPQAFDTPGAPPNGSDYVRLRSGGGYLRLNDIDRLRFDGASILPPNPINWSVDGNPPGQPGDAALYSGTGDNRDEAIVRSVAVPTAAGASLTFNARWNLEEDSGGPWDFGYVQISTDGGETYQSLTCTDTRTDHNPGAIPIVVANLPGFSGDSALVAGNVSGWNDETCSLAPYAGQTVLLSFRTINDPATQGTDPTVPPGFWVDDVAVGGTTISDGTSLAGWQSPSEVNPTEVHGFTLQLVAYRAKGKSPVRIATVPLNGNFDALLDGEDLEELLGKSNADFVGAIVMYDEPTETVGGYAPYRLVVNGALQPGGS